MLAKSIERYLEQQHVEYSTVSHIPAYTASHIAESAHMPGRSVAKVVIVKVDGRLAMMAIPAHKRLDLAKIQQEIKSKNIELAHEYEFNDKFPGCEVGAMPPFGDLFGMDVYVADSLAHQDFIAFNCGSHAELLRMKSEDFLKLVHPKMLASC